MTPYQKLAVLLILLGEDAANPLLGDFSDREGRLFTAEITKLQHVSPVQQTELLKEFTELALQAQGALGGSAQYARAVLEKTVGVIKAAEIMDWVASQQIPSGPKAQCPISEFTLQRIAKASRAGKSKLVIVPEPGIQPPERITIEVLKLLLRENPATMSQVARNWVRQTLPEAIPEQKTERSPSALRKLAALLMLLGEESASAILKRFDGHERRVVAAQMANLPFMSLDEQTAVLNETVESVARLNLRRRCSFPEPEDAMERISVTVLKQFIREYPSEVGAVVRPWIREEEGEATRVPVNQQEVDQDRGTASHEEAAVAKLANLILCQAVSDRASEIRIEPLEKTVRLSFRIDGVLVDKPAPPKILHVALISRLKVLCRLTTAEPRSRQVGTVWMKVAGRDIDLYVSFFPTVYGEVCVLRIIP